MRVLVVVVVWGEVRLLRYTTVRMISIYIIHSNQWMWMRLCECECDWIYYKYIEHSQIFRCTTTQWQQGLLHMTHKYIGIKGFYLCLSVNGLAIDLYVAHHLRNNKWIELNWLCWSFSYWNPNHRTAKLYIVYGRIHSYASECFSPCQVVPMFSIFSFFSFFSQK